MNTILTIIFLLIGAGLTINAQSLTLGIAGLNRTGYSGSRQVLIPKFDPAMGTLTSISVSYSVEYSGTIGGYGTSTANTANGWSTEFSGVIRLSGAGFGNLDYSLYNSRSGLIYQDRSPVFESFGPTSITSSGTFTQNMSGYVGSGNATATLAWPSFKADLFFSRSGVKTTTTRDLGAIGGQVTYNYTPIPEADSTAVMGGFALISAAAYQVWYRQRSAR